MSNFNKVILVGNLGQDPEVMDLGEGRVKTSFSLATNESFMNRKGERENRTHWHSIYAWGKRAEYIKEYCQKGTKLLVEGKLVTRSFESKSGEKKKVYEIQANSVEIMEGKVMAEPF